MRTPVLLVAGALLVALIGMLALRSPAGGGLELDSEGGAAAPGGPLSAEPEVGGAAELLSESGTETREEARVEAEALGSPPPATAGSSISFPVTGRVVDTNGAAIAGAWVRASGAEATTDEHGRFELRAPLPFPSAPVRSWVDVGAPGFASVHRNLGVHRGAAELGDIVLSPGSDLDGVVVDTGGLPIEGARLLPGEPLVQPSGFALGELVSQVEPLATTGPNGKFQLEGRALGPLRVHVFHPRFPTATFDTTVLDRAQTEWRIELEEGATVAGRVLMLPAGASSHVRAVPVGRDAEPRAVDVGPGGDFEIAGLQADAVYRFGLYGGKLAIPEFEAQSIASRLLSSGAPCSDTVDARASEGPIELVYTGVARVAATAVSARDGVALSELGAYLELGGVLRELTHGESEEVRIPGRFTFLLGPNYPEDFGQAGPELMLTHPDFLERRIRMPSRRPVGEFDLGEVVFEPAPRCSVTVVDAVTGVTLPGAEVRVSYGEAVAAPSFITDWVGRVDFPVQAGRGFELSVKRGGFATNYRSGLLHSGGEVLEVEIALGRGSILRVSVLEADGSLAEEAQVFVHEEGRTSEPLRARIDAGGLYVVSHLASGRYRVSAYGGGSSPVAESAPLFVDLDGTETREVELRLPPRVRVSGTVRLGQAPLGSAKVECRAIDAEDPGSLFGPRQAATTRANGTFEMEVPVPEGEVEFTVRHSSLAAPHRELVQLVSPVASVDLFLPSTRLTGRVRDDRGLPVGGAIVKALVAASPASNRFELEGAGSQVLGVGGRGAIADEQGWFELQGLPTDGEFYVEARPPQRLPNLTPARSEALRLAPDETREGLELTLLEGGTLWIEPEDASGQPIVACFVVATAPEGASEKERRAYVGSEGRLELMALAPGTWKLRVQRLGSGESQNHTVEIYPGRTETLRPRFEH